MNARLFFCQAITFTETQQIHSNIIKPFGFLDVEVYSEVAAANTDPMVGRISIPLSDLANPTQPSWFRLKNMRDSTGKENVFFGSIKYSSKKKKQETFQWISITALLTAGTTYMLLQMQRNQEILKFPCGKDIPISPNFYVLSQAHEDIMKFNQNHC